MTIQLLAPRSGRLNPDWWEINVHADTTRQMIALNLRRGNDRLDLFAHPDAALDLTLQIVAAVMRLRDLRRHA